MPPMASSSNVVMPLAADQVGSGVSPDYDGNIRPINGLYDIGDAQLTETLVEAVDTPKVTIGPHVYPAITFPGPGFFWFRLTNSIARQI